MYFREISEREAERLKRKKEAREASEEETDVWNIKVKNGVYDLDLVSLMKDEPIIIAGEEGRYLLSLASAFKGRRKKKL